MQLATREDRLAAFNQVPEHLRDLVRTHCQLAWDRERFNRGKL
jgi:hypothetical protein